MHLFSDFRKRVYEIIYLIVHKCIFFFLNIHNDVFFCHVMRYIQQKCISVYGYIYKEPYIHAKEPYIYAKEPYIHAVYGYIY